MYLFVILSPLFGVSFLIHFAFTYKKIGVGRFLINVALCKEFEEISDYVFIHCSKACLLCPLIFTVSVCNR